MRWTEPTWPAVLRAWQIFVSYVHSSLSPSGSRQSPDPFLSETRQSRPQVDSQELCSWDASNEAKRLQFSRRINPEGEGGGRSGRRKHQGDEAIPVDRPVPCAQFRENRFQPAGNYIRRRAEARSPSQQRNANQAI